MAHTPEVKSLLVEQESPGGKLAAIYLVAGENESTSSVCGCRIHRIESLQKGQSHVRMEFCPMHLAAPELLAAAKDAAILIVQGYGTMGKGFQDAPADHIHAKRRLEAAIAKATE